jgi:hypothetical protein
MGELEKTALSALKNLKPHSPSWVTLIKKYIAQLKRERKDAFTHGYLIAVANIVNMHGETVIAEDVLRDLGGSPNAIRRLDLTDYDAKPLRALFREIKRRDAPND